MNESYKKSVCPECGNIQEERYKYCQHCMTEMDPPRKIEEPKTWKNFIKNHPMISFFILLIPCSWVLYIPLKILEANDTMIVITWLLYLGVFTGFIAKLRGRSILWGLLCGIGLLVVWILPIKNCSSSNISTNDLISHRTKNTHKPTSND